MPISMPILVLKVEHGKDVASLKFFWGGGKGKLWRGKTFCLL